MNVVTIGTDRKIFEEGSAVAVRQIEYAKLCTSLSIVVVNRGGASFEKRLSSNLVAYSVPSLWAAFFVARRISKKAILSIQDPFETGFVGVLVKMFTGAPLQLQLHTDFYNRYFLFSSVKNFIRFFIAHITLPYADGVRVVSSRVKKTIQEFNSNVVVLPIRVPGFEGGSSGERRWRSVLVVCRLEKEKNLETALEAFALAVKKYPDATFTIAGDGSQKESLKLLAKSLNLENKVNFVGWVSDLPKLYAEHDIYISTSLFEGYGMSIVEAAGAGCALVISDAGVAGELFVDEESALVCEQKNIGGFAEALETLFADGVYTRRIAEKAKQAAERTVISAEEYLSQYRQNLEDIGLNYKKRNFVKALFAGNKVLRFITAGGFVALTQILLLYILTDFVGIWYLLSSVLSFVYACTSSFFLQKFWAFRDNNMEGAWKQFVGFIIVAFIGMAINTSSMYTLVDFLGIWYVLAQFITGFIIAVINFLIYKFFIFKR